MTPPPMAFRAFSARLGKDPLQVQGPGGNTSWKTDEGVMWIKASGTELADAMEKPIFVATKRDKARAEAMGEAGDGTCRATVIESEHAPDGLRPSIETTFHALFDDRCVAHTHSVATLSHCTSDQGLALLPDLLDMPFAVVPYAMSGMALTQAIRANVADEPVVILANHGLIVRGPDVGAVSEMLARVEDALSRPAAAATPPPAVPDGFEPVATVLAGKPEAGSGTYWPDHVVFLGAGLPTTPEDGRPAVLLPDGAAIRTGSTPAQRAMLDCLSDVLARIDPDWTLNPIGPEAEAALLGWDAEKYRQALAARAAEGD